MHFKYYQFCPGPYCEGTTEVYVRVKVSSVSSAKCKFELHILIFFQMNVFKVSYLICCI